LAICQLQAGEGKPAGRAIDISESATSEVTSNLHQLNVKQNSLKQLEEDLFKPLKKSFSPKSSLDAILVAPQMRPPVEQVVPSKKAREKMEREKNWVFMSPDEFVAGPTMEEIFNLPEYDADGQEKKPRSAVERYYDSMDRKAGGETNNKTAKRDRDDSRNTAQSRNETKSREDEHPRGDIRENDTAIKRLFESNLDKGSTAPGGSHGTFSDIFGLGQTKPSVEWTKAHNERLDEFKQMLGLPSPSAGTDPLKSLSGMEPISTPLKSFGGGDSSLSSPLRPGFDFQSPAIKPLPSPAGLPGGTSLGLPSFAPAAAPRFEPPKVAPPLPNFNTPKRAF